MHFGGAWNDDKQNYYPVDEEGNEKPHYSFVLSGRLFNGVQLSAEKSY